MEKINPMKCTDEAMQRRTLVQEARKLYIDTGITRNISEALDRHLRAHVQKTRGTVVWISNRPGMLPRSVLDDYVRPKCRKCGADMRFSPGCRSCRGPVKKNRWVCLECRFVRYTKDTLEQAILKLVRREDGKS